MSATSAQTKDFNQNDCNKRRQDLLCKIRVSIVTHSLPRGLPRGTPKATEMLEQTKNEISNKGKVSKSAILDFCFCCFKTKKNVRSTFLYYLSCELSNPRALFICPCKVWVLFFSMMEKISSGRGFSCIGCIWFFACSQNAFYAALAKIVFRYLYKNFQKIPIMKNSGLIF